jgi:hypothetical protein
MNAVPIKRDVDESRVLAMAGPAESSRMAKMSLKMTWRRKLGAQSCKKILKFSEQIGNSQFLETVPKILERSTELGNQVHNKSALDLQVLLWTQVLRKTQNT